MSRGKRTAGSDEAEAAGKLLRELAERAENDPDFGIQIAEALRASGLLGVAQQPPAPRKTTRSPKRATSTTTQVSTPPDPFPILRQRGEEALRAQLAQLDIATLRQIVRAHRLDPARISARWTSTDRVITLIVDQVRARVNHGRTFERI